MHVSLLFKFLLSFTTCLSVLAKSGDSQEPLREHPILPPIGTRYFEHSSAHRVNTDAIIFNELRNNIQFQHSDITIAPIESVNLFAFAAAGHATVAEIPEETSFQSYKWRIYIPPFRRADNSTGDLTSFVKFGIYSYIWEGTEFTIYLVDGRDGDQYYPPVQNQYIIGPSSVADSLILAAGVYSTSLHDEIWVYDQGYWQKDALLFEAVKRASWDNVILDSTMKADLIGNVLRFFDSEATYAGLSVPWKRGIIFHGPPGNGKTISIKATMHTLLSRSPAPIPTLYVKTLSGYGEWALAEIFRKARSQAPCYLVFEDLDSLVTDGLRSYFLNQIDGLEDNNGILMVGSTNHLERLDPGISKRPSRFDRKFFFPNPVLAERVQYCLFWKDKLADNKQVEFPKELAEAVANITDGFSFAYIQEAFVASLLLIAGSETEVVSSVDGEFDHRLGSDGGRSDLEDLLLWRVIKVQVKQLRHELEDNSVREDEEMMDADAGQKYNMRGLRLRGSQKASGQMKLDR